MSDEASVRAFKKSAEEHGFHPESLEYRYMSVGWDEATRQAEARSQATVVKLTEALQDLVEAIEFPDKLGGYLLDAAERALAEVRKRARRSDALRI